MNNKLMTILDGLPPLLLEANIVLGIQQRAADVGILVDKTFVQARLKRWQDGIDGIRGNLGKIDKRVRCPEIADS